MQISQNVEKYVHVIEYEAMCDFGDAIDALANGKIIIMKGVKADQLDEITLSLMRKTDVVCGPRRFFNRKNKNGSSLFQSGNGEGFPNAPILPHNEGMSTMFLENCQYRYALFWVDKMNCEGGENVFLPNCSLSDKTFALEGHNYLLNHKELFSAPSHGQVFPYDTTWFDETVYNTFVDKLRRTGLLKVNEIMSFNEYIETANNTRDFPLSPLTNNFSTKEGETILEDLYKEMVIVKTEPNDLIVFDNESFMHARAPFTGERKIWTCFLKNKGAFLDWLIINSIGLALEYYRQWAHYLSVLWGFPRRGSATGSS